MIDDSSPPPPTGSLSPETLERLEATASAAPVIKRRGRQARSTVVRRNKLKNTSQQVPIVQPRPDGGSLTPAEAQFIQGVTHPASPTFLQPGEAQAAAYPADPKGGTPSRVERLLNKPDVARTLKDLLDTPELRLKIQAGLDTILDDVAHTQFRPKEWTDALRAWAELTGNKAPDKIIAIPVNQADRAQRYEEIVQKIRGEETSKEPQP